MVVAGGFGSASLGGDEADRDQLAVQELQVGGLQGRDASGLLNLPFLEVFVVEITQERACTTPTLPASGVPAGHFWPFL